MLTFDLENTVAEITAKFEANDIEAADQLCTISRDKNPTSFVLKDLQRLIHDKITVDKLPGATYLEWLQWFHGVLSPATYVEIGVESGQSLQYAKYPTVSIGIDPAPKIVHGFNSWAKVFKLESDKFFETQNLHRELNGNDVNLAFIDGLHYYDQALNDFINIEKYSTKNTIVLFHDVFPAVAATATREWNTTYWAGDTWKVMPILAKYRPDLKIYTLPAFPTGVGIIANLDPTSTVLRDNFAEAVKSLENATYDSYVPVNVVENNFNTVANLLWQK